MSLLSYWPTPAQVRDCIRTEAETTDEAVLLAVHQSIKLKMRWAQSGQEEEKVEQDLLNALLSENTDGSAVLIPITGPSGVGKSHMIRWLHAQLLRDKRKSQLHIIIIPKTASLRKVVELILEPLEDTPYKHLRKELETAISKIPEHDAAALLATNLSLILEKRAVDQKAAIASARNDADRRILSERTHHAASLSELLRDIFFQDELLLSALERIVRRTLRGSASDETQGGVEQKLPQFYPEDLVLASGMDIKQAAKKAQNYYAHVLNSQDGHQRTVAVSVLNECIDQALRDVFRFSETLGRKTIEEIVNEIRALLLKEKKDLVLLIEDFASLSGIQEPLLKLCIAESESHGKKVRATLRTALAVTDGFDIQRDTIMTRAKRQWIIQSRYSNEDELIDQCIDMAGRYLNAARWGKDRLQEQFHAIRGKEQKDLYGWVKTFEDPHLDADAADVIKAFGFSNQGYALFPFNRSALYSFCRVALKEGGSLTFNPRIFINAVLQETLNYRQLFESQIFPPKGFKGGVLQAQVAGELRLRIPNESIRDRLTTLIVHWCGNPRTIDEVFATSKEIFSAFKLSLPGKPPKVTPPEPGRPTPPVPPRPPVPPEPVVPHPVDPLIERLDAWAGGGQLDQNDARAIRKVIAEAIADRMDWTLLRIPKSDIRPEWFWIPGARTGNPTIPPIIKISQAQADRDGSVRRAIAALRHLEQGASWDYKHAEDDYASALILIDRLAAEVESYLIGRAGNRLAVLVEALTTQSSILGAKGRENTKSGYIERLFSPIAAEAITNVAPSRKDEELRLVEFLDRATRTRPQLQRLVLEYCGCFQGVQQNAKVMGLDAARLERARGAKDLDFAFLSKEGSEELRGHFPDLTGQRFVSHVKRYHKIVTEYAGRIASKLGESSNKQQLVEGLQRLFASAYEHNLVPDNFVQSEWKIKIDEFQKSTVSEILLSAKDVSTKVDEANIRETAKKLGRVNVRDLIRLAEFFEQVGEVTAEIERRLTAREATHGVDPTSDPQKTLATELERTERILTAGIS